MTSPTDQISTAVDAIRSLIAAKATSSVVGWCGAFNLRSANDLNSRRVLHSPARQTSFLLGLLLSTSEPSGQEQLEEDEWRRLHELLNEAFGAYQLLYYPTSEEPGPAKEEWVRVREVAMPAFMHYVGSDLMASVEQVDARIQKYLTPFDAELTDLLGITATDALGICRWLAAHLHDRLLASNAAADAEKAARLTLLERAEKEKWSLADLRAATQASDYGQLAADLLRRIDLLNCVYLQDLKDAFPASAESFWRCFTIKRGSGPALAYPTEQTAYDLHPLISRDETSALCPS
jgi:hypothetical protein